MTDNNNGKATKASGKLCFNCNKLSTIWIQINQTRFGFCDWCHGDISATEQE